MPRTFAPSSSHSPVWMPARISTPSCRTASPAESAQRTARAGPSNAARKPSPAVSTSRPRKRSSSRRTAASWVLEQLAPAAVAELDGPLGRADDVGEEDGGQHAVGLRHRPRAGQELLDLVGELVDVRRRRSSGRRREARRTSRPGSWTARYRPSATLTSWSPVRWRTSVGTWIVGRTSRTSMYEFMRRRAAAAPGLAARRRYCSRFRTNCSSPTRLGA